MRFIYISSVFQEFRQDYIAFAKFKKRSPMQLEIKVK